MITVNSLAIALCCTGVAASAAEIMPNFGSTVPGSWATDRYEPAGFTTVDGFQGRDDVLQISISEAGNLANRPPAYQSTFYNTQGRKYTFAPTQGAGSQLSADLYIPATWGNSVNGSVRTDMWGTMDDGSSVSAYPILGFTNYGGDPRLRVWDDNIGWVDLLTPISYNSWNSFEIDLSVSDIKFFVNGSLVYTDTTLDGTVAFREVIMQAYNFADPSIGGANPLPYSVHWSNTKVPDAGGTFGLLGVGLGLVLLARRQPA